MTKNKSLYIVLSILLAIFLLASFIVFPLDKGLLGNLGISLGRDLQGGTYLVYKADLSSVEEGMESEIMKGVANVISNRINPLGVTESSVEIQGENQIVVEIPGVSLTDAQKTSLGSTALLEFRELATVDGEEKWIPATGTIDGETLALTSAYFKSNTSVQKDQFGKIYLVFEWDETGSELSKQITTRLIGKNLAIFENNEPLLTEDGHMIAPTIQAVITDKGQIEGLGLDVAMTLSKQLNAGRLPVSLEVVYEETVTPTLGSDFVQLSLTAGIVGLLLIMLFMCLYYRMPGIVASLALIFYAVLVLAIFKLIPVTLTLAGIGGFVLSIGMAIDANILIFERMKEELQMGRTLGAATESGFKRAWSAIRDSNITTMLVCVILFWVGSSTVEGAQVRGFSLTLFIGICVSMFTAITVSRSLLRTFAGTKFSKKTHLFTPYIERKLKANND
ncbi:MAG: protein translocase subunit SecD [Dehalococcoidales bacterium]|nr:protein translocase subunit SecD [Dehalococcoidales bacterium]